MKATTGVRSPIYMEVSSADKDLLALKLNGDPKSHGLTLGPCKMSIKEALIRCWVQLGS